jgi:recombination endonuclease VII
MKAQTKQEISRCQKFLERSDISDRDREMAERGLNDWFLESIWEEIKLPVTFCQTCAARFETILRPNPLRDNRCDNCRRNGEPKINESDRIGICDVCLESAPLNKDHCHSTGIKRGRLCRSCNVALGHFKDDISRLERAISYLKEWKSQSEDVKLTF